MMRLMRQQARAGEASSAAWSRESSVADPSRRGGKRAERDNRASAVRAGAWALSEKSRATRVPRGRLRTMECACDQDAFAESGRGVLRVEAAQKRQVDQRGLRGGGLAIPRPNRSAADEERRVKGVCVCVLEGRFSRTTRLESATCVPPPSAPELLGV
jgi:hypothetical protein